MVLQVCATIAGFQDHGESFVSLHIQLDPQLLLGARTARPILYTLSTLCSRVMENGL